MGRKLTKRQINGTVKALAEIGKTLDEYGWVRGHMGDIFGGFCLIGAAREVDGRYEDIAKTALGLAADSTLSILRGDEDRAITYNDDVAFDFNDIKKLISKAKRLVKSGKLRFNGAYAYVSID